MNMPPPILVAAACPQISGLNRGGSYPLATGTRIAGAAAMIRKLQSGEYRLYSKKRDPKTGKRKNLGTFATRAAAEKHEREVQFFKRR
jgi:hypothetical protein